MNEYHFITLFIALALCGSILDESRGLKRKLISATELAVASKSSEIKSKLKLSRLNKKYNSRKTLGAKQ